MTKIAILGGSGYLASILRDSNRIKKNKLFFYSRKKNLKNDIKHYSLNDDLYSLKNFDIVIHLSGPNQTQLKNNSNLIKKKKLFTKEVCDFCIKYKIKLIYLSSMQVYKNYGIKGISKNS
ncbi:NAD-dependent epimerase/dehydratase family protein, partial [Candidatus Pelagibacter bacterium]|nr:NAD-dependent epimerase/dehydratase family protein [Candidatus Pelagibacter bacterium]